MDGEQNGTDKHFLSLPLCQYMRHKLTIFLAILSGVCFGVAITTHLLVTGSLNQNYRAYIVQSGSMEPALPVGSIVFTKSADTYSVGEIITFSDGNNLVTHRIVNVDEASVQTKGDANEEADNRRIENSQIIGKQFLAVPYLGYFADFVRTPRGFVAFVVIPAAIIIYEELKALLSELKQLVLKKRDSKSTVKTAVFLPIFGGLVFMFFSAYSSSYFSDNEVSSQNGLAAASDFETPTPENSPIVNQNEQ